MTRTSTRLMFGVGLVAGLALAVSDLTAQAGPWKSLLGKDLSALTVPAGGGGGRGRAGTAPAAPAPAPSMNPADRGWKLEGGVLTSGPAAEGQRTGGLQTVDTFKDFEFETDFMLSESGTRCTPKLGDKQANLSEDRTCTFNSGISFRSGYQLNIGRREAGEYIGVVVHREVPFAIRGNVAWLSTGDCGAKNNTYLQDCDQFPQIRKKSDWNHLRIMFKGNRLQIWLNEKQITDVMDDPAEAGWKDAQPLSFQYPPAGESGGFQGTIKHRNMRVRAI